MLYPAELPGLTSAGASLAKRNRRLRALARILARRIRRQAGLRLLALVVMLTLLTAPAAGAACGRADGLVTVTSADERLDLVLSDGRTVRLAGVALPGAQGLADAARDLLAARFVGKEGSLMRLAAATDRWGRILGDVAPSGGDPAARRRRSASRRRIGRGSAAFETRNCADRAARRRGGGAAGRARPLGRSRRGGRRGGGCGSSSPPRRAFRRDRRRHPQGWLWPLAPLSRPCSTQRPDDRRPAQAGSGVCKGRTFPRRGGRQDDPGPGGAGGSET